MPASATFVPPREARKVMLPPGVSFPARQACTYPKQVCWGRGLEGHFLSKCKTRDPRLIEIALEGFRAKKRERAARVPQVQRTAPQFPQRSSISFEGPTMPPPSPQRPPSTQVRVMVAQDVEDVTAEGRESSVEEAEESL